jgi:hypothetical protein
VRDARTIHGRYGANARPDNCHRLTLLRIGRVDIALDCYQVHVPRAPSANRPPQKAPTPGSATPFTPSRIDPLNREPVPKSAPTVPFKSFRTDPLNREPTAKSGSTVPFKPFRTDPLNREPATKPGATAPRLAGSNAPSAGATAQPVRAHDPAPRPGQSGEASKIRPAPAEAGRAAPTLLPSPDSPVSPAEAEITHRVTGS